MSDLAAYLRARLDEDEAAARAADVKQGDPHWGMHGPIALTEGTYRVRTDSGCRPVALSTDIAGDDPGDRTGILDGRAVAEHIARWDPARVLSEVAAKRAVLGLHPTHEYTDDEPGFRMILTDCMCESRLIGKESCCTTLLALVQPYAGRADFDPAWLAVTP